MVERQPAPEDLWRAGVARDARQRGLRTLAQGLAVDVAIAVATVAATQAGDVRWTKAWWAALGLLLAKTALGAAASWLHRHLQPPA